MGICNSCDATHVATAKLVLQDGRLQEFPYPVKASYVLQRVFNQNSTYFICNADDMEFDDVVSAVREDEELIPGQLYFALPVSRLKQPLQPEEMAALAVKASSALMKSGGNEKCGCRRKLVSPAVVPGERRMVRSGGGGGSRRRDGSSRARRNFTANLSAIPE